MEEISREELQKLIDKAQKDLEETLSKMTPEERAEAEERANRMMAEDAAKRQRLIDDAAGIAAGIMPGKSSAPKFCPNCGAPAGSGKFCEYCGGPLRPGEPGSAK